MLKVTTRYLASNFIPPFAIGFVFFVAFLITFYMFRIINLIVNKGVDILTVLGLVGDLSVSFFPLATPLAVFFATIYTLNKFSEDSEIIAMRSFGMTKFMIYRPFLGISLVIALTVLSLNNIYIPNANANFRNTIVRLTSTGMLSSIKSGQFFTDIPNVTLFAEDVIGNGDVFEEIFLHLKEKNGEERIIMAKEGALVKIYGDQNNPPSLRLNLRNGNIVKVDSGGTEVEKILFEQYDFPIFSADIGNSKLDKDVMKVTSELLVSIDEKEKRYQELVLKDDQSENSKNAIKEAKKSHVKAVLELYERFLIVPQVVLFVLLGFTLGIKKGRGGNSSNSAKAFLILIGYYGFYFFFVSLAQRGVLDAAIASFAPSVILLFISSYFYRKLDWVG